MGISALVRVENRATAAVRVLNIENPATTGHGVAVLPGSSLTLDMWVPWATKAADFATHRLEVQLNSVTRFWLWQAKTDEDGDHVRFSTDGAWHDHGRPVHGISAVDQDITTPGVRTLIVWDNGIELRLLPDGLGDLVRAALGPGSLRMTAQHPDSTVPSVPKAIASAFSMAGPPAEAFQRGQAGARFLYRDSGKRYSFQLRSGVVVATDPSGTETPLTQAISYQRKRSGEPSTAPAFDLIAANCGRVFAKEKDADRFFFATMDDEFIHVGDTGTELAVPGAYFKLDPEFGQPGARTSDLLTGFRGFFGAHPSTDRFPLFELGLGLNLIDVMMVTVKPRVWHRLDLRPPSGLLTLEILGLKLLINQVPELAALATIPMFKRLLDTLEQHALTPDITPPPGPQTYDAVTYTSGGMSFTMPSIDYDQVLDIGVGHSHWHEQYERITGGEIQPMRNPKSILPLVQVSAGDLYRFLNGPVRDGDGFIDGTCNYYALVHLRGGGFALLYADEQSYFSQRWRLAHPDDTKGLQQALAAGLAANPDLYDWDRQRFWSPFDANLIAATSRLAVSRQVALVSAPDPANPAGAVIFSINLSWASMDRSWRWRALRDDRGMQLAATYFASDAERTAETIAANLPGRVYPETIRLREDMTINVKGTRQVPGQPITVGRWFQRYLPAGCTMPPLPAQPGVRPDPYTHPWKFLPEAVYQAADRFHHLGVYDTIDSRGQYYVVRPVTAADEAALTAAQNSATPWTDPGRRLCTRLLQFQWAAPLRYIDTGTSPLQGMPKSPPSVLNADTRLRIVRRGTQWIATHHDKRDDDLIAFDTATLIDPSTGAPKPVALTNNGITVNVTFGPNVVQDAPPQATRAELTWTGDPAAPVAITLNNPGNVWRVRMAALDPLTTAAAGHPPQVVNLLDVEFTAFVPTGSGVTYRPALPPAQLAQLAAYCTSDLATAHGTSIWLQDLVGHVATPDAVVFTGTPPAPPTTNLWYAARRPDGSWLPKTDLAPTLAVASPVTTAAAASAAPGETQILLGTRTGGLLHTMRHPNGSWDRAADATGQIGPVSAPVTVSAVSCTAGEMQFMIATLDGALVHTMRHANGTWDRAADVRGQIGPVGHVTAAAAAALGTGEAWYLLATDDGGLWHTTRHANGSWDPAADLTTKVGNPGLISAVAATTTGTGELQIMLATRDGGLWHALRHPTGAWDRVGDVRGQIGNRGTANAVTAACAVTGEAQFLFTTTGGLWHTIRHPNGSWDVAGDVHGQLGALTATVACATSANPGEVQFLLA